MDREPECRVCEEPLDDDEDKSVVQCDVCGCDVHEECAVVTKADDPADANTWCECCENQFEHALSKEK